MPADPIQTRSSRSDAVSPLLSPAGRPGYQPASGYGSPRKGGGENLFLWTVFLLGLVVLGMSTWIGTTTVFSHPEHPLSYRFLTKLKKIHPPERFSVSAAPTGEFITPEKLYARCAAMSPAEFREWNLQLTRGFLRNYANTTKHPVPYLAGRFSIMDSYVLTPKDVFPSGVAALAVSAEDSRVWIEHIYSAPAATAPLIKRNLPPGTDIELRRTFDLSAVVHAAQLPDGHLLLTVVPLNYGSYGFKGTSSGFNLEPPGALNLSPGWPVLGEKQREEADQAFVAFRQRNNLGPLFGRGKKTASASSSSSPGSSTAVTGIDAPPPAPPAPGDFTAATPAPTPPAAGKPGATPAPAAVAANTNARDAGKKPPSPAAATPAPSAAIAAAPPAPVRVEPAVPPLVLKSVPSSAANAPGASLQPFAPDARPAVAAANASARDWPTYPPGKQPSGRQIKVTEVASLGEQPPAAGAPLYLSGQFVVSAIGVNPDTGERNAVMRPRDPAMSNQMRVVVRYPGKRALPAEGAEVSRDDLRPFQITDVRRTADGRMLNVFVREIAAE